MRQPAVAGQVSRLLWSWPPPRTIVSLATARVGGRWLAVTGDSGGGVRVWDLDALEESLPVGSAHGTPAAHVALAEVGERIVVLSVGVDGSVVLAGAQTFSALSSQSTPMPVTHRLRGQVLGTGTVTLRGRPTFVVLAPDQATAFDAATGERVREHALPLVDGPTSVHVTTAFERPLALLASTERVVLVDLDSGDELGPVDTGIVAAPLGTHLLQVTVVATTPQDPAVLVGGTSHGLRAWGLPAGGPVEGGLPHEAGPVPQVAAGFVAGGAVVAYATQAGGLGLASLGSAHLGPGPSWRVRDAWAGGPVAVAEHGGHAVVACTDGDRLVLYGDEREVARLRPRTAPAPVGPVLRVAVVQARGRPVVVAGPVSAQEADASTDGDAGQVRIWDLDTGETYGAIPDRAGLRDLAPGQVGGAPTLFTADPSGVRGWALDDGRRALHDLTDAVDAITRSHVEHVALHTGRERSVLVATIQGLVLLWDAGTARPLHSWTHRAPVTTLATLPVDGTVLVASGDQGGTVQVWDATTGTSHGYPLTGPALRIAGMAPVTLDGRPALLVAYALEVWLWDLDTGTSLRRAPRRTLLSTVPDGSPVAAIDLDGRPVAVLGTDTGEVELWDVARWVLLGTLEAHPDAVCAVAVTEQDGRVLVVSGSAGGEVRVHDVSDLLVPGTGGVTQLLDGENIGTVDRLSRTGLAAHVDTHLHHLLASRRTATATTADPSGSAIVHIDGRWGAGKTTLLDLLLRPHPAGREPFRSASSVLVRYDAWRQSTVAPEWWSVAAELRREIARTRAWPTRVAMTVAGFAQRVARSTATWVAVLVLAGVVLAGRWLLADPGTWQKNLSGVVALGTAVSGGVALTLVVSRGLFWSAPVLGRLHQRTDENPLDEISRIVAHLRRWSPRVPGPQLAADWLVTVGVVGCVSMAVWWPDLTARWDALDEPTVRAVRRAALGALLVLLAVGLLTSRDWWADRLLRDALRQGRQAALAAGGRVRERLRSWRASQPRARWARSLRMGFALLLVAALAVLLAGPLAAAWSWLWSDSPGRRPTVLWSAGAVLCVAVHAAFTSSTLGHPRRTILLVVDDLDRCEGPRVVRLLETVHTLLRDRSAPRRLRRWRAPAHLGVLVLANGAWVRSAFTEHYAGFDSQHDTDDVHDLGADFLQKIFDHTVLVPALSSRQADDLVHAMTGSWSRRGAVLPDPDPSDGPAAASAARATEPAPVARAAEPAPAAEAAPAPLPPEAPVTEAPVPAAPASESPTPASGPAPAPAPTETTQIDRANADLAAGASSLVNHLLTGYPDILPRNARLIIRVGTSWAMLRAVADSLGLPPDDDLTVRAAVFWVRFPLLVDQLLDDDAPPVVDPAEEDCTAAWARRDVQQVLTLPAGSRVDIEALAARFGRTYAPAPRTPHGR